MSGPRLGFVGLGWIGAMRMDAAAAAGAEVAALCEPSAERLQAAAGKHPEAARCGDLDAMLRRAGELRLDGVVIATPNALHVAQTTAALDAGLAVFCQKPLGLDAAEAAEMVEAARRADRLLGVDYSYRHTDAARALKRLADAGELGRIFSLETVFHNAYGPDKAWCQDPAMAGGGALMDLGVHMVDLPLWLLGFPDVREVRGLAYRGGEPLDGVGIDDFATARIELDGGAVLHTAVSWHAHAGADCEIAVRVFGTAGGAELRNTDGSFLDFASRRLEGRQASELTRESSDWLGRGIAAWVERLKEDVGYGPEIERSVTVAEVIDAVYAGESNSVSRRDAEPQSVGVPSVAG